MYSHRDVIAGLMAERDALIAENTALRAQLALVPQVIPSRERLRELMFASEPILRHPARYDLNPPPLDVLNRFADALRALEPGDREPLALESAFDRDDG